MSANSALLGKGCEFEQDLKVFKALYPSLVLQLIGSVAVGGLQQGYRFHEKTGPQNGAFAIGCIAVLYFPLQLSSFNLGKSLARLPHLGSRCKVSSITSTVMPLPRSSTELGAREARYGACRWVLMRGSSSTGG